MTAIAVFFILLTAARWIQDRSGAVRSSFTAPDEAAHYVTSLMIRDYIALGAPTRPIQFAEDYYLHYPRVAFGIWPPLYHIAQAGWMLAVSDRRSSALLFNCVCVAVMGFMLFAALWRHFGFAIPIVAALILVSLPLVEYVNGAVLADVFLTVLIFGATLAYAKYLDHTRVRDAVIFGLLAAAAILTKYNGLALALLPVFAFVVRPRLPNLRRLSFWLPAIVVVVCCAPWYILNWNLVMYAAERGTGHDPRLYSAPAALFIALLRSLGIPLIILAAIGAVSRMRGANGNSGLWISCIAAVFSVYAFHTVGYPSEDSRYLLGAVPPLLILAAAGAGRVAAMWRQPGLLYHRAAAAMLLAAAGAGVIFPVVRRPLSAATDSARFILDNPEYRNTVILVVSEDGGMEGAVISEIAMREKRPGHYVARSSKVLARERIMGNSYVPAFTNSTGLMAYLDSVPVGLVILEPPRGGCHVAHVCQTLDAIRNHPDRWRAVATFSKARPEGDGRQLVIYEVAGNVRQRVRKLAVDMKATLNRDLSTQ